MVAVATSAFPQVSPETVDRYDISAPRYTSYPTVPHWTRDFTARNRVEALERVAPGASLSLYAHVPFCERRCRYCGCNVVIARDRNKGSEYVDRLLREVELTAAWMKSPRTAALHLGGGTPTFLPPDELRRLTAGLLDHFPATSEAELSLEVDPAMVTAEQLAALVELGYRRISFGVQDLHPSVLDIVGRPGQDVILAERLGEARQLGFTSINFDLIYGLPGQTAESWERTLDAILEMAPDRLAIYGFAFLPDQRPNQRSLKKFARPEGADKLALLARAHRRLCSGGYVAVGMDHFARPDDTLARAAANGTLSRNFQGYTAVSGMDTLAFGMSAISDVGGAFFQNPATLAEYAEEVDSGRLRPARGWLRTDDDHRREAMIRALMCQGRAPWDAETRQRFTGEGRRLRDPELTGLVKVEGDELVLTPLGLVFPRNVARIFDAYIPTDGEARYSRTV
jgi:oxygen-independent coproporphyrinogen-3 oxidase